MSTVYEAFGRVPSHVPPSVKVRRWDQGLLLGLMAFAILWPVLLWLSLAVPGPTVGRFVDHLWGAPALAFHWATLGISLPDDAQGYLALLEGHGAWMAPRVGLPLFLACGLSVWATIYGLTPRSNEWHVSGPQVMKGKEALKEARKRGLGPKEAGLDRYAFALHPRLVLPKKQWSRHVLISGSVGSGKTVVLLPIIEDLIRKNAKTLIYDVKGDMTAKFPQAVIVSPFDERSRVWDIGEDVRTPTQAAAFAASLIPDEEGNGKFWSQAAQQILSGSIRYLQNTRGTNWGWSDLAEVLSQTAQKMLPMLQEHYRKAAPLVANPESQATSSVLATLAGYTRVVDDLALAWPTLEGQKRFSITRWARDDYRGRRQVIVQAGPDAQLTKAYIAAMVNVAVPVIISPQLPDNEEGRCLAFVLDELPSIGPINLGPLVDRGRSKGVVVIAGFQDLAQLRDVYGENQTKALSSMVGTKVICQMQAGETRDEMARLLGKRKVAWRTHDDKATVHEEAKNLMHSNSLTDDLGFRKGKGMGPEGWGIRAVVYMGGNPMVLDFPGRSLPDKRVGQVPAAWTTKPAGQQQAPLVYEETDTEQLLSISSEEWSTLLDRAYQR
jgi:hypothetical protein